MFIVYVVLHSKHPLQIEQKEEEEEGERGRKRTGWGILESERIGFISAEGQWADK